MQQLFVCRREWLEKHWIVGLVAALGLGSTTSCSEDASGTGESATAASEAELMNMANQPRAMKGNVLIADQFNNRVIEVNRRGKILWQFGIGPSDLTDKSIIGVNDAQRVGSLTLMAGTGAPPGTEPNCDNGCADNRVLLVTHAGRVVWQYGQFGVTGAGANELSAPVQSTFLPNVHVLITDQGNQRVIEVNLRHEIVW